MSAFSWASQQPFQHGAEAIGVVEGADVLMTRAVGWQNRSLGEAQEDATGDLAVEKHEVEITQSTTWQSFFLGCIMTLHLKIDWFVVRMEQEVVEPQKIGRPFLPKTS